MRGRAAACGVAFASCCGAALAVPAAAAAQVISGVVIEDGTDAPIAGALVELLEQGSRAAQRSATTAAGGEFRLALPGAGEYRLRISRIGYLPVTTAMYTLAAGDSIHERLSMPRAPVALDTLRVERRDGRLTGFDKVMRRQRENNGIFIPGAIFEMADPPYPSQYLQYLIGALFTTSGGELRMPGARCTVLWIDEWHRPRSLSSLDQIPVSEFAAIEVYRTFRDVPEELQVHVYPCGLINVWTSAAW
jgi:hypothetical protein